MSTSVETASITDKGLGIKSDVNEDSYLVLEKEKVFAVADGVGGAAAGDVASKTVVQAIRDALHGDHMDTSTLDTIELTKTLVRIGNEKVYEKAGGLEIAMGSTIALVLIRGNDAVLAHVGDSRIYLYRRHKLLRLTKDHSKLQKLIDMMPPNTVDEENFVESNVITKALGAGPTVEPDIQRVNLKDQDIFIICTDGVHNYNSDREILKNLEKNSATLDKVCQTLKEHCYAKGAKDHLTAIVVRVTIEELDAQETKALKRERL